MRSIKNADRLVMLGAFSSLAVASIAVARQSKEIHAAVAADRAAANQPAPATSANPTPVPYPIDFYVQEKRDNLFFAKTPAPAPPAPPVVVKRALPPPPIKSLPPFNPGPPPDPFADYTYIGSVTVNEQIQALIENKNTREGWYVTTGATFQGVPVANVDLRSVTLLVAGQPRLFAKSTEINLSPMNSGAAKPGQPGAGQPGQPGPGQPGQPGPGGQVPGGAPGMVTPPVAPQAVQRRQLMEMKQSGMPPNLAAPPSAAPVMTLKL